MDDEEMERHRLRRVCRCEPGRISRHGSLDYPQFGYSSDGNSDRVHTVLKDGLTKAGSGGQRYFNFARLTEIRPWRIAFVSRMLYVISRIESKDV